MNTILRKCGAIFDQHHFEIMTQGVHDRGRDSSPAANHFDK